MEIKSKLKTITISDIKPYEKNAKLHTNEQIDLLRRSLETYGYYSPIGVDKNNVVVFGHGRLEALKSTGANNVEVVDLSNLSPTEIKKLRILDNKIVSNEWDDALLQDEIERIAEDCNQDISDIAKELHLSNKEIEKMIADKETIGDDDVPESIIPITKQGDLWELGKHRLLCGDSTKEEDFKKLFGSDKANLYFTDPPYSVNYTKKAKEVLKSKEYVEIKNDNMSVEETKEKLWRPVFENAYNFCTEDSSFYLTMPQGGDQMMMMMMMNVHWQVKHELIWVKDAPVFSMNRLDYDYMHEPIAYGWKKKHNFYRIGEYQKSVWNIKRVENKLHPTMKPVELVKNAILNSTMENCIVLDTFLGSGSTLIACEATNRKCFGLELDEHYCDVIRDRYIKFCLDNGKTPSVKLNGKPYKYEQQSDREKEENEFFGIK